jgi:hypothetical protein
MCNKSGTELISTAGGSLDAKYHDARDESGKPNIFSLSSNKQLNQYSSYPELSKKEVTLPSKGGLEEIILSGHISNHRTGVPLLVKLIHPDGVIQNFSASFTNNGNYRAIFSINENSLTGVYKIHLSHNNVDVGGSSFTVHYQNVPEWVKNNAKWWSINVIPDSEFVDGLEHLIDKGIIKIPSTESSLSGYIIPEWIKTTVKWWSNNDISDDEFLTAIEYLVKEGIIRI